MSDEDKKDYLAREYSDWELFTRLMGYTKPHFRIFITALITMFFSTILSILQPIILAVAIDEYILPKNLEGLELISLAYLVISVVSFSLNVISSYYTTITGIRLITQIRTDAFYKLQELSLDFYDKEAAGRIISRVTNDVERLLNLLSTGIIDAIVNVMFLGTLFFILFYLNPILALTVLIIFPILAIFVVYFRIKARSAWQRTRRALAKVTGYYQEAISGIEVSKAFAAEEFMSNEFKVLNLDNYEARIKALMLFAIMFPVMDTILALGTAVVLSVGGISIGAGILSVGILVAFLSYLSRLAQPIMTLSNFYNDLLSSMAATERILDILDRTPSVIPRSDKMISEMQGIIEFKDLTFSYVPDQAPVLKNFDLTIPAKATFAIVGHTGAGKTTITNLLCRFYDFNQGEILVDGVDIRDYNIPSYRKWLSIIPQSSFLFSGTVRENLLYGNPDASEEQIEKALLRVGAFDFVCRLGLDAQVGERGSRLSFGERQLLCFARALIADPSILLLDEATSSVDAHTELVIQESLQNILQNRTAIIIAHRLSTVRSVDQILVIEEGKIKEMGTFDELLNKKGIFTNLYEKQFAGQEI
ncbi:MAG: ABC transporter ATP-binding protein [Candidatus Heimdallarchaeota archaeon]|nr:ABC transporter ATP-binding protein [Candidatus Heimdallarchaeota archaeon]